MIDEAKITIKISSDGLSAADAALQRQAECAPDGSAFIDSPDRHNRGLGAVRRLTWKQANDIVSKVAREFTTLGLERGNVIALQLPNIVEGPLAIVAAWRAGLVPCLIPVLWDLDEVASAFYKVKPHAALTVTRFGDRTPAVTIGEATARQMSLRFPMSLGDDAPDGITPVDTWFAETEADAPNASEKPDIDDELLHDPDAPALITWTESLHGPLPVSRTHRQIFALAELIGNELRLGDRDTILNPYPYVSAATVSGQLIAPMLASARTVLHLPFDYATYAHQLSEEAITCPFAPAPALAELERQSDLQTDDQLVRKAACVWPNPFSNVEGPTAADMSFPVIDIHTFGELAVSARQRLDRADPSLHRLGKVRADSENPDSPVLLELRIRGGVTERDGQQVLNGHLNARGSTVASGLYMPDQTNGADAPALFAPDAHGFVNTGINCETGETTPEHFRCEKVTDLVWHGGMVLAANELDDLYASFPEFLDAASLVMDDKTIGDRIFAAVVPQPHLSPSLGRLREFLVSKRVAPYKIPDQIVIVNAIPRDHSGAVIRDQILTQI